ncbi:hypothetical protein VTO42DRAFT_8404 [Malbranchea cinnamomea]
MDEGSPTTLEEETLPRRAHAAVTTTTAASSAAPSSRSADASGGSCSNLSVHPATAKTTKTPSCSSASSSSSSSSLCARSDDQQKKKQQKKRIPAASYQDLSSSYPAVARAKSHYYGAINHSSLSTNPWLVHLVSFAVLFALALTNLLLSSQPHFGTHFLSCLPFFAHYHPSPRTPRPLPPPRSPQSSWCERPQLASLLQPGSCPVAVEMSELTTSPVALEARRISNELQFPSESVNRAVKHFMKQMEEGLAKEGATLSQIPSYVAAVPNGTEKGLYLAVDLGGTNFRVCSIQLHGDSTYSMTQSKVAIPRELMVANSGKELFEFLARQVEQFLLAHHTERFAPHVRRRETGEARKEFKEEEIFELGFTFSFPVIQRGRNQGTLLRWTKGFDIPDVVGQDVCKLLQDALDERHLPIRVAALINDTVGTLMARSYSSPGSSGALMGAIFGTGTNGAYVEKFSKIKKMATVDVDYKDTTGEMVINTEWGSFDNELQVLPNTQYDKELDADSVNPGIQMFEKRVSGMFLGEILRRALLHMVRNPAVRLFDAPVVIPEDSGLYKIWGIDTSFLSIVKGDTTPDLSKTRQQIELELGIANASTVDCQAVKTIVHAVGKRAARLGAVALAAVVISSGRLETDEVIDIGVDGSLVELYPDFERYIREAFREIPEIGVEGDKKIRIGIAKDGSGVGAALGALVASRSAPKS